MKNKSLILVALTAAFFVLPIIGISAYAYGDESFEDDEQPVVAEELPEEYTDVPPQISVESIVEPVPFTPPGTGTVVDSATDADGKLFYTIMTPDEHIFYLVIDRQRSTENVYFLNAVTVADLMALAEMPASPQGGMIVPPPETVVEQEQSEEIAPLPEPEPEQSSNAGVIIFIIILAAAGGVAGWYFKIYKPKQEPVGDNEYEKDLDNSDNGYADDWDEDIADVSDDAALTLPRDEDSESEYTE